jgi:hypothetical protein
MNPANHPVWIGWAATVVVAAAARYGLQLSDDQAAGVALVLGTGVQALVHRVVTPTRRPRAADGTPLLRAHLVGPPPAQPSGPVRSRPFDHERDAGDPPE